MRYCDFAIGNKVPITLTKSGDTTSLSPRTKPENSAFGRSNVGGRIKVEQPQLTNSLKIGALSFYVVIERCSDQTLNEPNNLVVKISIS